MIKKTIKIISWIFFGIVLLIGGVSTLYWKTSVIEKEVEKYLNNSFNGRGEVHYSSVKGGLINHIVINDLDVSLQNEFHASAKYLELHYKLIPLLFGKINISKAVTDKLVIELKHSAPAGIPPPDEEADIESVIEKIQKALVVDEVLDVLPSLTIKNFRVIAAEVILQKPEVALKNVHLHVGGLSVSKNQYKLSVNDFGFHWQARDFRLKSLSFKLAGNREHLTLNQCDLATDQSSLSMNAYLGLKPDNSMDISVNNFNLDFSELYKLIEQKELQSGFASGTINISGSLADIRSDIRLKGKWKKLGFSKLDLQFGYKNRTLNIKKLDLLSNAGAISFQGIGSQTRGGQGELQFSNLDINLLDTTQVPTDLTGAMAFNVKDLNLSNATGTGKIELHRSSINALPVDQLMFALDVNRGNFTIVQPSFVQLADSSRFNLEGSISGSGQMDASLSTFNNQLGQVAKILGVDSLLAVYDAQLRLRGPISDPVVSGNLWMPMMYYKEFEFDSVAINVYVENIFSRRQGEAVFEIREGRWSATPFKNIRINAQIDSNRVGIDRVAFESGKNYLNAAVQYHYNAEKSTLLIPKLEILYEDYRIQNEGDILVSMDSREINLEHLRLKGPAGSAIEMGGFWDYAQEDLQIYITLDKIRIKPFEQIWQKKFQIEGIINGTIEVLNPLHDLDVTAEISLDDFSYNGLYLGKVESDFLFSDNTFRVSEFKYQQNNSYLNIDGDFSFMVGKDKLPPTEFLDDTGSKFNAEWKNIDIGYFTPLLRMRQKITGITSGSISLEGTVSHPRIRQYLKLDNFTYKQFKLDSLVAYSQYNDGYFLADSISGVLNATSFDLRGWMQYDLNFLAFDTNFVDKPFQLALRSKDDEISFIGLLNEQVETISGDYDCGLQFGGTLASPGLHSGHFQLEDGTIDLSRVRDPIRKVNIDMAIENSVMTINHFNGYSARKKDLLEKSWQFMQALLPWSKEKVRDGYLRVSGDMQVKDLQRPMLDLKVRMDEFYVDYFVENAAVALSSKKISIAGRDTITIGGKLFVPRGTYEVDLSKMEKNVYMTDATVLESSPLIAINLDVEIPGNFVIASSALDLANNFKIVIMGDLNVIMEPPLDAVQIAGHMETVSGKYASWNQNFEVKNGAIDFKNPKVINPEINLLAVKKIGDRIFEIVITGNLENMTRELNVLENGEILEMSYMDKIALLTLGADIRQITTQTDSTLRNVGEDVATTSMLTAVERGAEKYVGLDKVEISSNESLLDLERLRLNNGLKDASVSFGKYLTSDLYIEYRTQFGGDFPAPKLSWDAGNRLGLQYKINHFWSIDSNYEKTDRGNNKIQVGLNWEMTF